jgi:anti-sigma regulatory factor (Ser/Thr protein kinase)
MIGHLFAAGHASTILRAQHPPGRTRAQPRPRSRILLRAELPVSPSASRLARQHLRQALAEHGLSALSADTELLGSELVANAAEHAGGKKIGLVLRQHTGPGSQNSITCEVSDHSATIPEQRPAHPGDDRGRGLAIIAALAAGSGTRASINGKTCWFTLTTPDTQPTAARAGPEPEAEAGA